MERPCQDLSVKQCPVHSVVVYRDRAEVKRAISLILPAGESNVVIKDLSVAVDGDSIRVEGQGPATILDVIYNTNEEKKVEGRDITSDDTYLSLLENIKEKEQELKRISLHIEVINKQKEMLKEFADNVTKLKNNTKTPTAFPSLVLPDDVSHIMEFMERYQNQLALLDERLMEVCHQQKNLEDEKKVLEAKAAQLNPENTISEKTEIIRAVKVTLDAKEKGEITLILSYVVSNASWSPTYDVRVFSKEKTMKVHYYGLIKQSTGEDWENVNLSLSTAQPNIGGAIPQLGVHYVGFKYPAALALAGKREKHKKMITHRMMMGYDDDFGEEDDLRDLEERADKLAEAAHTFQKSATRLKGKKRFNFQSRSSYIRRQSSSESSSSVSSLEVQVAKVESGQMFNTTYAIPRTATIPADNTEHKVTVAIIDLQPEFKYVSVPRLSPHSFLQSTVKNMSSYTILSGPANIFLDNNFLAKSQLADTSPNEEFTTSLGADQSIHITCHPMKILRGTAGRLTKTNLLTYTYVYSVKNTQANIVKVKVMEQIPLSDDEKLKVVIHNPDLKKRNVQVLFSHGHSVLNDDNNIEWHCTIPPDAVIDLQLIFTIEFPLNDIVEGLPNQ